MPSNWRHTVPVSPEAIEAGLVDQDLVWEIDGQLVTSEPLHPIDEAILRYLNTYDQPQSLSAICAHVGLAGIMFVTPGGSGSDGQSAVERHLEALVEAGRVEKIIDGVNADGSPHVEWAPVCVPGATRETRSKAHPDALSDAPGSLRAARVTGAPGALSRAIQRDAALRQRTVGKMTAQV